MTASTAIPRRKRSNARSRRTEVRSRGALGSSGRAGPALTSRGRLRRRQGSGRQVAHLGLAVPLEQAVGRQPLVAPLADALGALAPEYADHVRNAEALLHPGYAGEDLLGHDLSVGHLLGVPQAQVAGAAGRRLVRL